MTGIYLTIATLAFAVIIQEVFTPLGIGDARLRRHGGRQAGDLRRRRSHDERSFYYLCLFFLVLALWLTRNLLRSPTGRAWIAIRDSEIAAQSMGVNLAIYKSIAFAYSAALMGLAGALFAHKIAYPGAGHLHHPAVDPVPAAGDRGRAGLAAWRGVRRDLRGPPAAADRHPARFDPGQHERRRGGHEHQADRHHRRRHRQLPQEARRRGRHLRPDPGAGDPARAARHVRPLGQDPLFFSTFPMYRGATFKRQKSYMRSERLR